MFSRKNGIINSWLELYKSSVHLSKFGSVYNYSGSKHTIKSFSAEVSKFLEYSPDKLLEFNFHEILSKHSIFLWEKIKAEPWSNKTANTAVKFIFITKTGHLVLSYWTVSRLLYRNRIIINSITSLLQDLFPEFPDISYKSNQYQSMQYLFKMSANTFKKTQKLHYQTQTNCQKYSM